MVSGETDLGTGASLSGDQLPHAFALNHLELVSGPCNAACIVLHSVAGTVYPVYSGVAVRTYMASTRLGTSLENPPNHFS